MSEYLEKILKDVKAKNQNEPEIHQAVQEILESLESDLCTEDTTNLQNHICIVRRSFLQNSE